MEFINVRSIRTDPPLPGKTKEELLSGFDDDILSSVVITTDALELVHGKELLANAQKDGLSFVPLKRTRLVKKTRGFPKRVLLELTNECNSRCTMCPRNTLTRPIMSMKTSIAKKVIKELAEVGISGLWLYNIGESLLHPDFFEVLDYCRSFDSLGTIWLSTNGEIVDDKMAGRLLACPPDILNYSVNAMTEENFRKISPSLHFHRVHRNLKSLIELKKTLHKQKPVIRAQMIELPYVLHEVKEFKEAFGAQADILSINRLEVFSQNVTANLEGKTTKINKKIEKCNRLEREDFFIFSDGSVSCCDTDFNGTLNIGNVNYQSIKEIYAGEKYQHILSRYRAGRLHEIDLCSRCCDYAL